MRKIIIFTIFFILNLFITNKIFAATLTLVSSKESLGVGEQFYMDLMLDPEGKSLNAIEGNISFSSDYVSFVRAEEGKSIVSLWVEKPKLNNINDNSINFSGIIPNGFSGVIDPFNPKYKLSVLVLRFVFEAKKPGIANFSSLPFSLYLNDGLGTEIKALPVNMSLNIDNFVFHYTYENKNESIPTLEAHVVRTPNIFNNKYTIIFDARDKEVGIKSVFIKEGNSEWKEIESPYKLEDQSRHSDITLQAINFSEASIIMKIDKVPYSIKFYIQIIIIILIVTISSIILIRKRYLKDK
ncbi:TPA: hypothetical protein DEP30_03665 [Candidatus Nomurabacteria bacterium]|nr:MAG: hypothetical protein UR97_C0009G0008 [Candidatus Nomurabacteria bacterium GW2011_GWE2_36_115]KKP93385.1 MAG: hypothetical protein US00_C0007G0007 [Candidatus Nomurabacteria bacterium GW2011_GWF2_36_126]KKP96505.1 MAG: hypothetical protein US04_C0001G0007 [Candidatus Nomurabacteria bacterium GW2011_GWD2_36_14]KKP99891.1 MAG: hypothetical protein US08_C0001G0574 [Candidatus Nomurabacteria bacterium GW2011_GWF2_36_19]KKQ04984.1 MAG: hypothetical protein US17_C0009G0007 [Candidatus Nomuraba